MRSPSWPIYDEYSIPYRERTQVLSWQLEGDWHLCVSPETLLEVEHGA